MQVSLNQHSLDQYLSIIKTFMLEMHQRVNEEYEIPPLQTHLITIIDQASVKLKTYKEQIAMMEQQLRQSELSKITCKELKGEQAHLEKRLTQKSDEISILRETVKTLYQDNERISSEKEVLGKEIASLKESTSSLRKKLKKQEEEICNHKSEVKKLTNHTEDKIAEYLRQDEEKQITIKRLNSELERARNELSKKQKSLASANKKADEWRSMQPQYEKSVKVIASLKEQNNMILAELQKLEEKWLEQKSRLLKEVDSLKHQLQDQKQLNAQLQLQLKDLTASLATNEQKTANYENEIIMRTDKLKQKNKQVKIYNEEINKLVTRVEQLSHMSDEVIQENQQLTDKCHGLEERLEQLRNFQNYISKIKGDISYKKSHELSKLMDSLSKLQSHA